MTSRRKHYDDEEHEVEQQPTATEVVQPGCNEPRTVPPSVSGTTQDPTRKKQKED